MAAVSDAAKISGDCCYESWQIGTKDILSTDPVADVDARVVEVKIRLSSEDSQKVANLTNTNLPK